MSASQFLDPELNVPQVMFCRHDGPELTVFIVRFRTIELALDAVRHNERVQSFATMKDIECPPFVCHDGTIKTAHRLLMDRAITTLRARRTEFAPCTCGLIKGGCACIVQKDGKRRPGNFEE